MFAYENLEVYSKAYKLNQQIYRFLKENKNIPRYVKDQLGRASLSIILNIAEGSAKFSNKDRKNFMLQQGHRLLSAPHWLVSCAMNRKFQMSLKSSLQKPMKKYQECFLQ